MTRRQSLLLGLLSVVMVATSLASSPEPASAATQSLKPGFNLAKSTQPNLSSVTNFAFLPGTNNLLATGKCGDISLGRMNGGDLANTTWTSVSWPSEGEVTCAPQDRGLLGIDVDGATVYLLYNYTGGANCAEGGPKIYGRVRKVTANSATAPSSFSTGSVILDCLPAFSSVHPGDGDDSHTVGTVIVAPDHTIFAGTGEASSYNLADPSAFGAQDVNSPRGKIFHVDANGNGLPSNKSWTGDPHAWASKVFAYGFRNPFRFSIQPGTGVNGVPVTLYIGDVGWNSREEIDVASGGENFGWPCWEGPLGFRNNYSRDSATKPTCDQMYGNPPANLKGPLYSWTHDGLDGDGLPPSGHAAMGGAFATGAAYGAYSGAYFFGDLEWTRLWAFQQPSSPALLAGACPGDAFGCDLAPGGSAPGVAMTALHQGPNNDLFLSDIEGNRIVELRFGCGGNCPPVVSATATPVASSDLNTNFHFDASASYDPDPGDTIQFRWDFGDGQTATGPVVNHRYDRKGDWPATVRVTDNHGTSDTLGVPVTTNHDPPTLTLTPNKSGLYAVGDPITITATARDENGVTIPGSSIRWAPVLHHCPAGVGSGGCHIHPQDTPTGSVYTTVVPDHGDDSYLEFRASVVDSNGYSTTAGFNLPMDEHGVFVDATVPGVQFAVNGGGGPAPLATRAITNSLNRIAAPITAPDGATFVQWSDGDTNPTKSFTMPAADVSFTARYIAGSGRFTPVAPYRLLDTRVPAPDGTAQPLLPGQTLVADLSSRPDAPAGSTAVLLNVTSTDPAAAGYVRAFPCGPEPDTSTVNFDPGQTAANLAVVRLPADGRVCFTSLVTTNLVVDVSGWYAPGAGGSGYTAVEPERVLDTRQTASLAAGQELRFSLAGHSGLPADATAALINVTATNTTAAGYVRAYPCGEEQDVSNVNYGPGETVANLASVKLAAGGDVCFRSWATTDLVVDLAGWYSPSGTGAFVAPPQSRLFDTRSTPGFARLGAGQELAITITGGTVPTGATAAALNVTAAAPDVAGYVAAYPCGTEPLVSNVNYRAGQVAAANLAVVKLPPDGRICFRSFSPTDLIVDLAGWYIG